MSISKETIFIKLIILLMGTIRITMASRGESQVERGDTGYGFTGNEKTLIDVLSSWPLRSSNICISTLTESTCTCEPRVPQISGNPNGDSPRYEGDEGNRDDELSKMTSTMIDPDCVHDTNFSTLSNNPQIPLYTNENMSCGGGFPCSTTVTGTYVTGTSTGDQTITPSILTVLASSTYGYYYDGLHEMYCNTSSNSEHYGKYSDVGHHHLGSSTELLDKSSSVEHCDECPTENSNHNSKTEHYNDSSSTERYDFSSTAELFDSSSSSETCDVSSSIENYISISTVYQNSSMNTCQPNPSSKIEYITLISNKIITVYSTTEETSCIEIEESTASAITTEAPMMSCLASYHISSGAWDTLVTTTYSTHMNKPTTIENDIWSDYWDDEDWSDDWPSELWEDVYNDVDKTNHHTNGKTKVDDYKMKPTTVDNWSGSYTKAPTSRAAHIVHSRKTKNHTREGSFTILSSTSSRPRQIKPTIEKTSPEFQTKHSLVMEPTTRMPKQILQTSRQNKTKSKELVEKTSKSENVRVTPTHMSSSSHNPYLTKPPNVLKESSTVYSSFQPKIPTLYSRHTGSSKTGRKPYFSHRRTSSIGNRSSLSNATITVSMSSMTFPGERRSSWVQRSPTGKFVYTKAQPTTLLSRTFISKKSKELTLMESSTLTESTFTFSHSEETSSIPTESSSLTLVRPWYKANPKNETVQNLSNASITSTYYLLIIPCFTILVFL